jgi:curved DNA-binding protein CbpA
MTPHENPAAWAHRILGLADGASDEDIRAAYLRGLREFPPDRAPEQFQKLHEAYDFLRNPEVRFKSILHAENPDQDMAAWVGDHPAPRRFAGPGPWLTAMKRVSAK